MTAGTSNRAVPGLGSGWLDRARHAGERVSTPLAVYHLLVGATGLLLVFGLIMVLSASTPTQYALTGSSYTIFKKQLVFAGIGLLGAFIASRVPVRVWKVLAIPSLLVALGLQALVFTGLGVTVNGNRNWLEVAGQRLQPSEFGKVSLVLVCALILSHKRRVIGSTWQAIFPVVPLALTLMGLVMLGQDMGTSMIMVAILAGTLFAAGARLKLFVVSGALALLGAVALVLDAPSRQKRVHTWLTGSCTDPRVEECYQRMHGQYALADGGLLGLGLGESREKWQWLPEAHNDFIFAVIGEELGLAGTLAVLLLFAVLGYACYRIVCQSHDHFVRIATAGVMVWLIGQALVNIGSVIGMLPIVGVPLPLVSSGGTALVSSLLAVGLLVSFARQHPEVRAARQARPSLLHRVSAPLPRTHHEEGRR